MSSSNRLLEAPADRRRLHDAMVRSRSIVYSLAVFALFLSYYFVTSNILPLDAGPDYKASEDLVGFIYKYERLAVLPADEDKLYFSAHGGTRALRPPLSFGVSAATAKALDTWIDEPRILYRKGSALLAAGAVAAAFYAASIYFGSYTAGLVAALLFGLLPQFAFIASYTNDDSGAIFTATLLLGVLVRILRGGVNWLNVVLLAAAGGLVVLSKQSAWLLAPTVLLFLAAYVRVPWTQLLKYAGVGLVVFTLFGGWWIAFNMYHYGLDDPFLLKMEAALAAKHTRFGPDKVYGYAPQGIGYIDLLFANYDNFWPKTVASTIGNLDWLRIRVGPLQYGLYLALFGAGVVYALLRLGAAACRRITAATAQSFDREVMFEALMVFAIAFQFYMYMWTNMHNDVQLQGKYFLPALLPVILLGISGARSVIARLAPGMFRGEPSDVWIGGPALQKASVIAVPIALIGVHIDAVVNYVVPFYRPAVYPIQLQRGFTDIGFATDDVLLEHDIDDLSLKENGFHMVSEGVDPWFVVDLSGKKMCSLFRGHNILKARLQSEEAGFFKVYVDRGYGFREASSYSVRYPSGESDLILVFDVPRCSRLRLDPAARPTAMEVGDMSLGKIVVGK